jgi:hypothetical protein
MSRFTTRVVAHPDARSNSTATPRALMAFSMDNIHSAAQLLLTWSGLSSMVRDAWHVRVSLFTVEPEKSDPPGPLSE